MLTPEERAAYSATADNANINTDTQIDEKNSGTFLDALATGGYGAANSLLMGLPDFIIKNANSDAYKAIEEARQHNQFANMLGTGAGTVGSFLVPAGAITKGIGLAGKVAGEGLAHIAPLANLGKGIAGVGENVIRAGEALKAGTSAAEAAKTGLTSKNIIGQGILRGAGAAAEQAIPRAIFDTSEATPEDKLLNVGESIALGGGLGGILGKLSKAGLVNTEQTAAMNALTKGQLGVPTTLAVPSLANQYIQKAIEATEAKNLANIGVNSTGLRKTASFLFGRGNITEEKARDLIHEMSEVANNIDGKGLTLKSLGPKADETIQSFYKPIYANVDALASKNMAPDTGLNLAISFDSNPKITEILDNAGDKAKAFYEKTRNKIMDPNANLIDIKNNSFGKAIKDGMGQAASDDAKEIGDLASLMRNDTRAFIDDLSGVDPGTLKFADQRYKLAKTLQYSGMKDVTKEIAGMEANSKTGSTEAINKYLMGGGALAGGAANAKDEEGNLDLGKALLGATVGGVAGGLVNKLGTKVLNTAANAKAGIISNLISKNPNVVNNVANKLTKLNGVVTDNLGSIAKAEPLVRNFVQTGITTNSPDPALQASKTAQLESTIPANKVAMTQQDYVNKLSPYMIQQLNDTYEKHYKDMDPKVFLTNVLSHTNNFTDMTKNAEFMFDSPEQKAKFLNRYNTYLATKNYEFITPQGKLGAAIAGGGGYNLPLVGNVGGNKQAQDQADKLRETLIDIHSQGDITKRKAAEKVVDSSLKQVRDNPSLMPDLLKGFGLTFDDLRQIGVV